MSPVPPNPPTDLPGGFGRLAPCRHGLMVYNPNDVYVGRSLDLYGEYSEAEAGVLRFLLRPGDIAVEAGSNIGSLTVPMAAAVGKDGWILAFEPQRIAFQMLCANAVLGGHSCIETHNAAVGAQPGRLAVPQLDPTRLNNFGGVSLAGGSSGPALGALEVPVVTIDGFGLDRCRLLKADVEGMEVDVLEGARETIARCRPLLYLENDRRDRSPALIRYVRDLGYRLWWHTPVYFNPRNFRGATENVFPGEGAFNVLCAPKEMDFAVSAPEILTDESWPVA